MRPLGLAAVFLTLAGSTLVVLSIVRKTILTLAVTDDLRGRVQGIDVVIATGGPQPAAMAHGAADAAFGATWAVTGGEIATAIITLATAALVPRFWRYRAPGESAAVAPRPTTDAHDGKRLPPPRR
jgi:hypothetical protein